MSTNWAGLVDSGSTYQGVLGYWTVPTVTPSQSPEYSGTWIGIDGASNDTVIQTGTGQDTSGGQTSYYAWYETYPSGSVELGQVFPGDQMEALVQIVSSGVWEIDIVDVTQNAGFDGDVSYDGPADSAEWITEAPTVNNEQSTLADFGSVQFTNMEIAATNPAATELSPWYMVNGSDTVIAYPGAFNADGSFPITYGSPPPPSVSSVTPGQGSTNTTVTISGANFEYGLETVKFGGATASISNVSNGSITATAPSHAPGTVDVTVSTVAGTSATSSADHYTYSNHGYWLVGSDGGIFTFGDAGFYGSTGSLRLNRPVVGIVPTNSRAGYWLDASDGGVFSFGNAGFYGSIPGLGLNPAGSGLPHSLNAPIVGMVPSASGDGYFMVGADGGVFAFGDAGFYGSCPGLPGGCAGPAVAVLPDATGNGYWLVTQTGNVYTFGGAPYEGAPGNVGSPVTSAVRTPDGRGYWILVANGTVYNYGDARNFGSPGGRYGGFNPATAIFSTSDGGGYWVAGADGSVDNYGDAPNDGSMAGTKLNGPIIAATGW